MSLVELYKFKDFVEDFFLRNRRIVTFGNGGDEFGSVASSDVRTTTDQMSYKHINFI